MVRIPHVMLVVLHMHLRLLPTMSAHVLALMVFQTIPTPSIVLSVPVSLLITTIIQIALLLLLALLFPRAIHIIRVLLYMVQHMADTILLLVH